MTQDNTVTVMMRHVRRRFGLFNTQNLYTCSLVARAFLLGCVGRLCYSIQAIF